MYLHRISTKRYLYVLLKVFCSSTNRSYVMRCLFFACVSNSGTHMTVTQKCINHITAHRIGSYCSKKFLKKHAKIVSWKCDADTCRRKLCSIELERTDAPSVWQGYPTLLEGSRRAIREANGITFQRWHSRPWWYALVETHPQTPTKQAEGRLSHNSPFSLTRAPHDKLQPLQQSR